MIRAVLFDCDGVLFDSHRANIEYFNAVLVAAGQPRLDPERERWATALAGSQLLDALFGDDRELVERVRRVAQGIDYGPFFECMQPAPGLFETLAHLKATYRLGMATNRGTTVPQVVERFGLGAYLDIAVGVLDVARPKPFPDMLDKCLAHFGLEPAEAIYVGDAPSDRQAAAAAGLFFIGVGDHTGGTRSIVDLRDLPQAILRLSQE